MGKKMYKKTDVSKTKTEQLGISSLLVLDDESDSSSFSAVHKRYFKKEKCTCPACQSQKTRTSKMVTRKLKDILIVDDGFQIIIMVCLLPLLQSVPLCEDEFSIVKQIYLCYPLYRHWQL